ncbi:MAG: alpha/beta fold hydrolase [Betaproteobacteria bacterium]
MRIQVRGVETYLYTGGKPFQEVARGLCTAAVESRPPGSEAPSATSAGRGTLHPVPPAVLFIHGAQNDHSVWIMQSRWMAHHGYAVLAPDLPGHGRSAGGPLPSIHALADWCVDLLDALKVTTAAWIGHSMGSLIALDAAARYRERSWANILLGSALPMRVSDALLEAAENNEARAFDMITRWSHSGIHHHPGTPGPGFSIYNQARRLMERQVRGVLAVDFGACHRYADGAERARAIVQPTLLVSADRDAMTPPKAASGLLAAIPGAKSCLIGSAGHQMMAEQPDAVRRALTDFLNAHRPNPEMRPMA